MKIIDADKLHYKTVRIATQKGIKPALVVFAKEIQKMPAIPQIKVQVDPVKRGHWEYVKKRLARGGYVDASECSICHKIIMPHLKPNYCPNCGAKMDEVEEDENDKRR